MSTAADALQKAEDALRALEREHGDSAAALDGRRARHREAASQLEDLHRRVKAADPDAKDFGKLSAERSTARDREEALRAQLARAEGEHKGLGGRLQQARIQHERATRAMAEVRINESSAELAASLSKFLRTFGPQIQAHYQLVVEENRARGSNDPFGVFGTGSPHPATQGFWNMLYAAHTSTLQPGTPEHRIAQQSAEYAAQMQVAMMNRGSGAGGNSAPPQPSSSAGTVGHATASG